MTHNTAYQRWRLPRTGDLRQRIRIDRWQDQPVGSFAIQASVAAGFYVWARVQAVGGQIYYGSKQTGDNITHRFLVRSMRGKTDPPSLTAEHVLEASSMRYRVRRVYDLEQRFTVIEATELGAVGA
jgi:hypothetical protein